MPTSNGITASIRVNGQALEEFKVNTRSGVVSPYIASQDANFEFFVDNQARSDVDCKLFLDGVRVSGVIAYKGGHGVKWGVRVGPTERRPFRFGAVPLTDVEEEACMDEDKIKGLGCMRLEVWRATISDSHKASSGKAVLQQKFHEKSKKAALSHSVGFGAVQRVPANASANVKRHGTAPVVTFVWTYMSRDLLEIKEIAPPLAATEADPPKRKAKAEKVVIDIDEEYSMVPRKRKVKSERFQIDLTEPNAKAVKLEDKPIKPEDIVELD